MDQSIMEYRTLEIKMISANDVKDVTPFFKKLMVFAVASICGDPLNTQSDFTDADGYNERNPKWNRSLKLAFKESLANHDRLFLEIQLGARLEYPNKLIGIVKIPLKELFDNPAGHQLSYQVRKINSEKSRGTLNLSYKFGDRVEAPNPMKAPGISIMEYRTVEIKMISANDIKNVAPFLKQLMVFAVVSICGDPLNPQTEVTDADVYNERNPKWNCSLKLTFKESLANQDRLFLQIHLGAKRKFPNKLIGIVNIPLKDLFDNPAGRQLSYPVRKINSWESRGILNLSYKFGDRVEAPPPKPMKAPGEVF